MFLRQFLAFVLHGVEEQAVVLLEDGQHGLAADRSPAAEGHGDLVLLEELLGLFGEERPVGRAVHDDGLDLLAHHAALGVDFVEGEEQDVAQRRLADGHGAAERVEDADFDGVLRAGGRMEAVSAAPAARASAAELRSLIIWVLVWFVGCWLP